MRDDRERSRVGDGRGKPVESRALVSMRFFLYVYT